MPKIVKTLIILLFTWPALSWSLSSDKDQAIKIEADQLEIRDKENISFYRGNVRLQQGSLLIKADNLTLKLDEQKKVDKITMQGKPASYQQKAEDGPLMKGFASEMQYSSNNSTMLLLGQAKIISGSDVIESHRIMINTQTNAIQAGDANADSKNRVHMLIQPAKSDQTFE